MVDNDRRQPYNALGRRQVDDKTQDSPKTRYVEVVIVRVLETHVLEKLLCRKFRPVRVDFKAGTYWRSD